MKRFLAVFGFLLAALPAAAQTRGPCSSDVVTNCYTPTVHPDVTGSGGSTSNAADGLASSSTNGTNVDFPYLYNGSTFDRWRGDATNGGWVNVKTSVLPTGAATSGNQTTANTSLASIDTKTPASPATAGNQTTANTSLASIDSKTPASPATAGNQTTANTSLASIDTKMPAAPATAGNQTTANTSLASIDSKTPAAPATAGNQTTANTSLASIDTKSGVPRTPATGTGTPTAVTVGVASAQALAAATRTQRLVLQNVSASANIACSLGGTAALNTAASFQIGPGQLLNLGDGLYIPGDAVNCIASAASTPLTAWSR